MNLSVKILVVDAFGNMRRIVKGILKQLGYKGVIEAEDGMAALQELKKDNIGLIMADWNIPKMTGLGLLKAVRSDQSLKDIPFIMITAAGEKKNVIEAVKAGVSNIIIKPFASEILKEKIEHVLDEKADAQTRI